MPNALFHTLLARLKRWNKERIRARRAPARLAYQVKVAEREANMPSLRKGYEAEYTALTRKPLISVVMPVYNAPIAWLEEAIESVRQQVYQDWELCIADDASTHEAVRPTLTRMAEQEPRIKLVFREQNGHISAASNSAVALCTGQFIALMDQDDLLAPEALLRVAQAISSNPDAQLIYSDEDILWTDGRRENPTRKGLWNPTLLMKVNYICHLLVLHRALMEKTQGFKLGVEGAQDHELVLNCRNFVTSEQVIYLAEVLYHWRAHNASTSMGISVKSYAEAARKRAVTLHATTGK